jgi:hypothetical protein
MTDGESNIPAMITLVPQFNWVFDKQFLELRNDFVPSDNSQHIKKERKEKLPPSNEKNENGSGAINEDKQNGGGKGGEGTHKEKSPLTQDNLMAGDQQHKENISSITDDNNNLSNDDTNTPQEPKKEIKFTPDYEAGRPIFLDVFNDLAKDNNGLVYYDKLQERLISTGKLDAGGSVLMIEHMEKTGKIEKTEHYNVYRRRKPASPE